MKPLIDNARVSEQLEDGYYLVRFCIDGAICYENCGAGCYREKYCVPKSSAEHYLNDEWERINQS